eukprot:353651-Chlamydomonas_euryale.AAC.4
MQLRQELRLAGRRQEQRPASAAMSRRCYALDGLGWVSGGVDACCRHPPRLATAASQLTQLCILLLGGLPTAIAAGNCCFASALRVEEAAFPEKQLAAAGHTSGSLPRNACGRIHARA